MVCVGTNPNPNANRNPNHRKRKSYDIATSGETQFETDQPQLRRICNHHQQYHPDWSHIGVDLLLEHVLKKLPLPDLLRCRSVCRFWRSVTKTHLSISLNSLPKPYPPLIIWYEEFTAGVFSCFFDVLTAKKKSKKCDGNLYLPNRKKSQELLQLMIYCIGSASNGGYFIMLDKKDGETFHLYHPLLLSGIALHLPFISDPYTTRYGSEKAGTKFGAQKALLWGDDDPVSGGGCFGLVVLHACYGPPLFAKCGDTQFSLLDCGDPRFAQLDDLDNDGDDEDGDGDDSIKFAAILCVKNHIYGITSHCNRLFVWDCNDSDDVPTLVLEFQPQFKPYFPAWRTFYLVESQGEILLVAVGKPCKRQLQAKGGTITAYNKIEPMCQVYKMDFNNKEWVRIYSLGDRVLFVTEYQSVSLSSHEFPQYQRNSIYYQHHLAISGTETCLGIFNMDNGSIKVIDAKLG